MKETSNFYSQLNTLRAFAVILVIIHHWLPNIYLSKTFPLGEMGVILFFVLSGFLITEILIKYKLKSNNLKLGWLKALKVFVIRRTLRIFPVYYLTLFFFFFLYNGGDFFKQNINYYLFYASNMLFYENGLWGFGSHLWTLAVEEQFYIFWPLLIFLMPLRWLLKTTLVIIFLGIAAKIIFPVKAPLTAILMPHCLDSFGLGALFALVKQAYTNKLSVFQTTIYWLSGISAVYFFAAIFFFFPFNIIIERLIISIMSLGVIVKAVSGFTGVYKSILENKLLSYVGTISYGIYLFHNFVPSVFTNISLRLGVSFAFMGSGIYLLYFMVLILASMLSWHLFEKPINALKEKFTF